MPIDPWLPHRLRHQSGIIRGEASVLKAALAALKKLTTAVRGLVGPTGLANITQLSSNMPEWREAVQDILLPAVGAVFGDAFRRFLDEAIFSADPYVARYLDTVDNRLVGVADTLFDEIRLTLEEGRRAGESIPDLAKRVQEKLGPEATMNRALAIARTEVIGAYNQGQFQAAMVLADSLGVAHDKVVKRWLATDDDRTRPTHQIADNQMQYLTEPFVVGGALGMAPGDPALPAKEVIQCRCTALFLLPGDPGYPESGSLTAAAGVASFHLPGRHNQKSHGNRKGRPKAGRGKVSAKLTELADWDWAGLPDPGNLSPGEANSDRTLAAMWEKQGFDGKPDLVSRADLDKAVADGATPVFRGLAGPSGKQFAEQFRTGDKPFAGLGIHGNGSYFATDEALATQYSNTGSTEGGLIRAALRKDSRVFDGNLFSVLGESLSLPEDQQLKAQDPGRFLTAKGYDAYWAGTGDKRHLIVLNRTALLVEEG